MNYCAVGEAFDNSLKQQIAEYENNNKENKDNNSKLVPPGTFDTYNEVETGNIHNIYPAFFTAQGDYNSKGTYEGTQIKDLQNCQMEDSENLSFLDSEKSSKTVKSIQEPTKMIDHNYCVNKIVKNILDDSDMFSMGSSENDEVYKHVRRCKICKKKINEKLKGHYKEPIPLVQPVVKQTEPVEHFNFNISNLGYNLKEILVIILGGIILIFILDLLVKIGKKMKV